ncbi:acetolactate synthase [Candidatus Vecturithrix granuli]|uniref:Acetolactate synthase n=1 Tax=Vecturithrix granuli TaxID=1499967 RepID=A0A081C419_VECG1|nr:acetolactate synthase [Candidatus Vecturithrix granuli]
MKKTGAEIVIESLKLQGVDIIFGYPGGQIMPIYDALYSSGIKHILPRHEQGACHAADGYARVTGKPGVIFATSGPGATNLVTGLATAHMDSVPIVAITGQVPTGAIGTDAFQEADIYGITIPVTKYNYLVKDASKLVETIAEAFYIATIGRPGPVLIDIPKDVQLKVVEYLPETEIPLLKYTPEPRYSYDAELEHLVHLLCQAQRPVLYIGGGAVISGASEQIAQFARKTSIPVTHTLTACGVFPDNDPLALGMPGMHGTRYANEAIHRADLLIAAGARFDDRVTGKVSEFAKNATIVHIDIDPAEIRKVIATHLSIVGDLKGVLSSLLNKLEQIEVCSHEPWLQQIQEWKVRYPLMYKHSETSIKPQYVIEQVSDLTKGEAIITTGVGQHQMWTALFYEFHHPRSFVSSGGLGTMGFGFPSGIGAKLGRPDRTVVTITGDGSFQMNIQELATASYYNVPVKVIILNNGFLGMVRQWQELFFERRYSETHLENGNPDFVTVAKGYGVQGFRIDRPEEVRPTLEKALAIDGPVIIDCHTEKEENVLPMIPPGGTVHDTISASL